MYSTESVCSCAFIKILSHLRSPSFQNAGQNWSVFPEDSDQLKGKDLKILTLALCFCEGIVQRKSPSYPTVNSIVRKPHMWVQNSYVALCLYSLIKVKSTYSKLYIFRVKKWSFDVCVLQWNYSHDQVNEYSQPPKNVFVAFVIFPLFSSATSFFPQATTNLLSVIIDSFEFSRILRTWNYTVCALFLVFHSA